MQGQRQASYCRGECSSLCDTSIDVSYDSCACYRLAAPQHNIYIRCCSTPTTEAHCSQSYRGRCLCTGGQSDRLHVTPDRCPITGYVHATIHPPTWRERVVYPRTVVSIVVVAHLVSKSREIVSEGVLRIHVYSVVVQWGRRD